MSTWYELRFWYATRFPNPSRLYDYKRDTLLPALRSHAIENFLILDEPEFMLLRIPAEDELLAAFKAPLENTLPPVFSKITVEIWPPTEDAKNRILSAKRKARQKWPDMALLDDEQGWEVKRKQTYDNWVFSTADLADQVEAFSKFMTHVAGRFTEAYLREMPHRIENRWLMSVFIHLMLDSISTWQREEDEIREFPRI